MKEPEKAFVSMGCQAGDEQGGFETLPYVRAMSQAIDRHVKISYGQGVSRMRMALRIDGVGKTWGPEGTYDLKWFDKEAAIQCEVGIPVSSWETRDHQTLRKAMLGCVDTAVISMVASLREQSVELDFDAFAIDWDRAKAEYIMSTVERPQAGMRLPSGKWVVPGTVKRENPPKS